MSAPPRRRVADIRVGEALPPLEMEISLTALVVYAAATWDFHRYHYDQALAAQAGSPAPFMDGQMAGALMARQVMAWAGPDAFVRKLSFRLRNMVLAGERILLDAAVTGVTHRQDAGEELGLVELQLSIAKADGTVVVHQASATVELPA